MSSVDTIFSAAANRRAKMDLPYTGAVTPPEAYALQAAAAATIVDVRTLAELAYVGRVPGALVVEWLSYPTMETNQKFMAELQTLAPPADKPVLFLCRSGVRSHYAATVAAEAGYSAYNVLEGFEGDLNGESQRNTINGWRAYQLPWIQS